MKKRKRDKGIEFKFETEYPSMMREVIIPVTIFLMFIMLVVMLIYAVG